MSDLPVAAIAAATAALHYGDPAEGGESGCACTSADQHGEFWHRDQSGAVRALIAAAPHVEAAERERCMPLTVERVNELERLARDMLARFVPTAHGLSPAVVRQDEIAKWQAVLDKEGGSDE